MTAAGDKLDFCKQALGELGTRSTITSLAPLDGSQEAYYCDLFFNGTRDQILRAAHWGFAGRSNFLQLWKALPGTPENPIIPPRYTWSARDPAPPWLYSYRHETDAVQIRRIRPQEPQAAADGAAPPVSGGAMPASWLGYGDNRGQNVPFEVSSDRFDRAGMLVSSTVGVLTFTVVAPGANYRAGDIVYFTTTSVPYGQPAALQVIATNFAGGVVGFVPVDSGTFLSAPASIQQSATTGIGTGLGCTATYASLSELLQTTVILTNARYPIVDFTTNDVAVSEYDPLFGDAFMLALEGKLALALLGDRALYGAKLQEANNSILNARVRDANEGLTVYDFVPDWIQARGVTAPDQIGGWLPQYGPLFSA